MNALTSIAGCLALWAPIIMALHIVPGWSIGELAIAIVLVMGIVALVFIASKALGVSIPPWVIQCFWVLVIVFVIVCCIRLLMAM